MKKSLMYLSLIISLSTFIGVAITSTSNGGFLSFGINNANACSHSHVNHYDGVRPTNLEEGKKEYWVCCYCHKKFADSQYHHEIDDEDLLISKATSFTSVSKEDFKNAALKTQVSSGFSSSDFVSIDNRESLYLKGNQTNYREDDESDLSTVTFDVLQGDTAGIYFEYKLYDLNAHLTHVDGEFASSGHYGEAISDIHALLQIKEGDNWSPTYLDLHYDNQWHEAFVEFKNTSFSQIKLSLYHFNGELFLSNLITNCKNFNYIYLNNNDDSNGFYLTCGNNDNLEYDGTNWSKAYTAEKINNAILTRNNNSYIADNINNIYLKKLTTNLFYFGYSSIWFGGVSNAVEGDELHLQGVFSLNGYSFVFMPGNFKFYEGKWHSCLVNECSVTNSTTGVDNGLFFYSEQLNAVPVLDGNWHTRGTSDDSHSISLIRDGVHSFINIPGSYSIVKHAANHYYLEFSQTSIGTSKDGDIIEINGSFLFVDNNTNPFEPMNIDFKSLRFERLNGTWHSKNRTFVKTASILGVEEGQNERTTNNAIFLLMQPNEFLDTFGSWDVTRFTATSNDNVTYTRGDTTYNIVNDLGGRGLVKVSQTTYYCGFTDFGSQYTALDGDIVTIKGRFALQIFYADLGWNANRYQVNSYFDIEKTSFIRQNGRWFAFGQNIYGGAATIDQNGVGGANGFYFTLENDTSSIPSSWTTSVFKTISENALVIDGVTVSTPATSTSDGNYPLVKHASNGYYVRLLDIGANGRVKNGTVVTISGTFYGTQIHGVYLTIATSSFVYNNGTWENASFGGNY